MEPDIRLMEERLERLELENHRIKRSARLGKILTTSTVALVIAIAAVPKVHSLGFPLSIAASEFDLLGSNGKITAKLATYEGGPNVLFFDEKGKLVEDVGVINQKTFVGAGISVWDGNAIIPGNGVVRESSGVTESSSAGPFTPGEGLATLDGSGIVRSAIGQTLDGSIVYDTLDDPQGNVRSGFDYDPSQDFTGFFTDAANGTTRSYFGQGTDDVEADWGLNYSSGIAAVNSFTPSPYSPNAGLNVYDTNGLYRSIIAIEFFGTFDASETLTGHLP
jgi:hypothetical protein